MPAGGENAKAPAGQEGANPSGDAAGVGIGALAPEENKTDPHAGVLVPRTAPRSEGERPLEHPEAALPDEGGASLRDTREVPGLSFIESDSGVSRLEPETLPPSEDFDPGERTGEDFLEPQITDASTNETPFVDAQPARPMIENGDIEPGPISATADFEESPTDQGPPDDDEITGSMSVALDQPTAPLAFGPVVEPELPKREAARTPNERRVAPDPEAGQAIGGYDLVQKLGKGGAGSVFRARRRSDGEVVALKVLAAAKTKRARIVQRFFDEVRAASAVVHPGLIRIVDFIEEEEPRRLAYAMEFVDGESLRDRLKRDGAFDLREAIHIGIEVCDALSALHDAGIVHRDLKPENIMLLRPVPGAMPRVKLLDFGVVKFLPVDRTGPSAIVDAGTGERPGTFVGTPRYMAPEQAAGGLVDARADLFAVGVLLFEMITGTCPHEGDSLRDVVMAKLKGAPRITMSPGKEILPQELTEVVDACLQLKPALRPKSARDVAVALREAVAVLFVVGPVKANEAGVPFRPTHSMPSLPVPSLLPYSVAPQHEGSAVEPVHPRHSTAPAAPPPGTPAGPGAPTAGRKGPLEDPRGLPRAALRFVSAVALGRNRSTAVLVAFLLVLAVALIAVAIRLARPEEEMLLVPLEAPSLEGQPGSNPEKPSLDDASPAGPSR
jgi:serine/threonine protein kinase